MDDTLLFPQSSADIEAVIAGLKEVGMDPEEDDDVFGFLGVSAERKDDDTIKLLQNWSYSTQYLSSITYTYPW
jgi:hypothetical protein